MRDYAPLRCRDRELDLGRVVLMGVLNVTPDSFSDGGLWFDPGAAVSHAFEMVESGAGIIDVGGESTRPGAEPVDEDEELKRVLPVIEALAPSISVPISIDTRKPEVAARAIEAGASILNDTLGEAGDGSMDRLAASTGVAIIVMHSRGTPATMKALARYDDVVAEVGGWLRQKVTELTSAGVEAASIALDPGIGFAKDAQHSLQLLNRLEEIVDIGPPVLVGASRKSFIGAVLDVDEEQRTYGTAAAVALSVERGARLIRVHDVAEMNQVVRMTEALMEPV